MAVAGIAVVVTAALIALLVLVWQGKRKPDTSGQYVALGSSFAAGLGLGPRERGSPVVCMRSTQGYPHVLAALTGLSLVDMSCSGSTTSHILHGGQVFLGPQLDAIGARTRLVTITSGGNDTSYIGDLTLASGRAGVLGKLFWKGPKPIAGRDFASISDNFRKIVREINHRAPQAIVVLVSYPNVLPEQGVCGSLGFGPGMADTGREVAARLHEATRSAAEQSGAIFVDMAAASIGHDACSPEPWINGARPTSGAPFHPTQAGARATAATVFKAIADKLS
jgi:lysophospholipase L1-like esterase